LRTENCELRTSLLINSRTDIALAAGADGVHLRSDDIPASTARAIWREAMSRDSRLGTRGSVIAVSCHSASDIARAKSEGADFAVFAPVFEKRDASGVRPRGLSALREACATKIPVLALGGVTIENGPSCLAAGAAGVAAIRLFQENKIEEVVRALRAL
ncbi:MAG: thiamine phosphate synthase, partial [Bryobacteraceae bacterium]